MHLSKRVLGIRGSHGSRAGSALLAAVALGLAGSALAQDQGVQAGWQQHRTTFDYLGISPTYSCQGLQDALTYLLDKSGAQLNKPVMAYPCSGSGPTHLLSANLNFSTLQPGASGGEDASGSVTGTWRHVEFSMVRSAPQLRGADCELVDEFRSKVLPMFTTRNVSSNLHCIPHQTIGNQFDLSFDVLTTPEAGSHHTG